jgi:hypothetical protein
MAKHTYDVHSHPVNEIILSDQAVPVQSNIDLGNALVFQTRGDLDPDGGSYPVRFEIQV